MNKLEYIQQLGKRAKKASDELIDLPEKKRMMY